ncbi:MAG: hypothetical protein KGI29_02970 [Pseudomonadota bacterium]|nr:hypothetical protein [Pseudomonadota bacterium]MDE3038259.1 hypothetical protein [Pseudomonadota bacterium]
MTTVLGKLAADRGDKKEGPMPGAFFLPVGQSTAPQPGIGNLSVASGGAASGVAKLAAIRALRQAASEKTPTDPATAREKAQSRLFEAVEQAVYQITGFIADGFNAAGRALDFSAAEPTRTIAEEVQKIRREPEPVMTCGTLPAAVQETISIIGNLVLEFNKNVSVAPAVEHVSEINYGQLLPPTSQIAANQTAPQKQQDATPSGHSYG